MRNNHNEKLVEAFQKMSDEQKAEFYKPGSAQSYEEIQKRLESMFCPSTPAPEKKVVEGWVARDKDGMIFLHKIRPQRVLFAEGFPPEEDFYELPKDSFPSITWESEPRKARIEITLVDDDNP